MKLYHATFSKLVKKIKKCGYLGNSPYKLWSDSNNKYVYLASDPGEAESYAETCLDEIENERLYDMLEDDNIVIFEIDTDNLDMSKLEKDINVIDGETTYQYEGVIPFEYLKVYDITKDYLNEMSLFAGIKLYESIAIEGKEYNGATEQYDYIKVYKNPDLEWLSEEVAYQSYKFIYANKVLYVWKEDWMHSEVMNLLPNIHNTEDVYCGAFEPNKVYIWSEISPNDDFNEACEIFESVFGDKLKIIYPTGYDFGQCC